jgi:7 transmembrane sweet-taste receptor of 3 GCPR
MHGQPLAGHSGEFYALQLFQNIYFYVHSSYSPIHRKPVIIQGFTITFAALFSKIWRVNKIMESAQRFRKVKITERDVMLPFMVLLSLNMIFLLVWTLVDPVVWKRESLCGSGDLSSYGHCTLGSGTSVAMFVCVVVLNACALLLANYQAYKARLVSTEYGESQYVAIIMMSILQIVIIGVPLMFLLEKNPSASYFVRVGVIFIICMSTLLLLFVPKMMYNKKRKEVQMRKQQRPRLEGFGGLDDRQHNVLVPVQQAVQFFPKRQLEAMNLHRRFSTGSLRDTDQSN